MLLGIYEAPAMIIEGIQGVLEYGIGYKLSYEDPDGWFI